MAGKHRDDFAADLVRQLHAAAPEIAETRVLEIAADVIQQIRRNWGGCRPYIRKEPTAQKAQRLAASIADASTLTEAFGLAGLSRSTGYRLRKRG